MENKQQGIIEELKKRIASGIYSGFLPTTGALAEEFAVNVKTMAKAVNHLVADGLLERKKHIGTRVRPVPLPLKQPPLVEVIFEGFTNIFTHPFWGGILDGMMSHLAHCGYRPVFNTLKTNPATGRLDLNNFFLTPAVGRIILGIFDRRIFEAVQADGKPYLSACDTVNLPDVPQLTFDFTYGIQKAVDYLADHGCRKIAFIGQVEIDCDLRVPHKYPAYCLAMRNNSLGEFIEKENATLAMPGGAAALKRLLARTMPDALIAAHDHQLPGILAELEAQSVNIPVIGCDGLVMEGLPAKRNMVRAPLFECGESIARQLISAIRQQRSALSQSVPALFTVSRPMKSTRKNAPVP